MGVQPAQILEKYFSIEEVIIKYSSIEKIIIKLLSIEKIILVIRIPGFHLYRGEYFLSKFKRNRKKIRETVRLRIWRNGDEEDYDNDNDDKRNTPVADHKEVIQTDFDFFVTWSELLTAGGHTVHAFYDAHDNTNNGAGTHRGRYQ